MIREGLFTSESVTEGHPDKACDNVSDAVLDACLRQDPHSRVACETAIKTSPEFGSTVALFGEITTNAEPDYGAIVARTLDKIGYTDPKVDIDPVNFQLWLNLTTQSPDIAVGVNEGTGTDEEQGAGDQGMMFGFACDETPELMPMSIHLAHRLCERLTLCRREEVLPWLRPDGKSQVTIEYQNGRPKRVHTVVVSAQHAPGIDRGDLVDGITLEVVRETLGDLFDRKTIVHINPTSAFTVGGPLGDAGLTGRKVIVDTYGGWGAHGGGCFSGKDPSKVDRSAAYMGRYIAKNIVSAGLAKRVLVQLAYAIGIAEPVSVFADTFGTGQVPDEKLPDAIRAVFPLKPAGIISHLDLLRPVYSQTAAYGHFGRTGDAFTWEKTDKAVDLRGFFNG